MPSATYQLFRQAILGRKQITCFYRGCYRELCPHVLGHKDGREKALAYQFAGQSTSGLPPAGEWRCFVVAAVRHARLREGPRRSGATHSRVQGCVDVVDVDVNLLADVADRAMLAEKRDRQPQIVGGLMRDKTLVVLIVLAVLLFLAHTIDHVIRGDVPLVARAESLAFFAITAAVCAFAAAGVFLYWRGKVGPRFWAISAVIAAAFGWFGHFSPFTEQPPRHILNAYASAAAGWLALGCLIALMLTLIAIALYAGYRWVRPDRQAVAMRGR